MNPALQTAVIGEPVTVTLGGVAYPLAYPVQAVILYQAETARIDRTRRKAKLAEGGKRLTREEIKELRAKRKELLRESYKFVPPSVDGKDEEWTAEALESFSLLQDEATQVKCELDEDAAKGDSLYDRFNWRKISPEVDPERFLVALWVGLHAFRGLPGKENYDPQLGSVAIGKLVHIGNHEEVSIAMTRALTQYIVAPKDEDEEEAIPNALPPATPAVTETVTETTTETTTAIPVPNP
jgi:hypothetical protein